MKQPTHPAAARAQEASKQHARILCVLGRASIADLTRFADILEALPDADIRQVAAFAESLAQWPAEPEGSSDGTAGEAQDFGG